MRTRAIRDLESSLVQSAASGVFSDAEVESVPAPVRRHLAAAIVPGTPLARSARLRMRGHIKIGRWVPFRSREVLTPLQGFVWAARAAGVIAGNDHYVHGTGGMDWRLAGLLRVMHADGPDVSRAAAERAAGEAMWVPTSLLPRFGTTWSADDDITISAHCEVDGHPVALHYRIDAAGHIETLVFDRWGDPDGSGEWTKVAFGGEVTGHRTFDGVTIPSSGRMGWFYGTDRWPQGEFIRYEITELELA